MNNRASLTVSMKILLMVTTLTLASAGSVSSRTTDLPHPWLTLDRSAKVLSLQCKPPEDASLNWRAVHDLRLSAFLPLRSTSSNISLVTVTSNMKEPKVNDLFTIHNVTFQGSWPTVSVSLDFLFPVTDKELGRYFCTVHHSDKDDKLSTFTTEMVVDKDLVSSHIHIQPKNVNSFVMKVMEAHEVRVTWTKPESLKFTEAIVSSMLVDEEGTPMAPPMSLYSTNGVRQWEYNSDVLLAKFNPRDSGNLSITLYVKRYAHSRSYRYTCRVPYSTCTGHRADSCTCCQSAANHDTPACSFSSEDSPKFEALFGIFLGLFLLLVVVGAIVLTCFGMYKFNKTDNTCVQNIFTPRREQTDPESAALVPQEPPIEPPASSKERSKIESDVDTDDSKINDGPAQTGKQISSRQKETIEALKINSSCNSTTGEEPTPYTSRTSSVESVLSNGDGSEQSSHTMTVHAQLQGTSSAAPTASQEEKEVDAVTSTGNRGKNHKTRASAQVAATPDSQSLESEGTRGVGHASNGSLPPASAVRDENHLNFESPSKTSLKVGSHEIGDGSLHGAVGGSADNGLYSSNSGSARTPLLDSSNTPSRDQNTPACGVPKRPLFGNLEEDHNTCPGTRRSRHMSDEITE